MLNPTQWHSDLWTWAHAFACVVPYAGSSPFSALPGKLLQSSSFFLKLSWLLCPSRQTQELLGSYSHNLCRNVCPQTYLWMSNMSTCLDSSLDHGNMQAEDMAYINFHLYRACNIGTTTKSLPNKWKWIKGRMFSHLTKLTVTSVRAGPNFQIPTLVIFH